VRNKPQRAKGPEQPQDLNHRQVDLLKGRVYYRDYHDKEVYLTPCFPQVGPIIDTETEGCGPDQAF
jgi:hypothetical protein